MIADRRGEHRSARAADQRHPRPRAPRLRRPAACASRPATPSSSSRGPPRGCCRRPSTPDVTLAVDTAPAAFEADADRIIQTLTNLIGNAVKFSPPRRDRADQLRAPQRRDPLHGPRPRARHPGRQARVDLRPLPAGRLVGFAPERRHRARAGHLPLDRRAARRPHLGAQQRRRGQHVLVRRARRCRAGRASTRRAPAARADRSSCATTTPRSWRSPERCSRSAATT